MPSCPYALVVQRSRYKYPFALWKCTYIGPHSIRSLRFLQTTALAAENVPFRKQLKDEIKQRRTTQGTGSIRTEKRGSSSNKWELTVGIEVHAQLNTQHKLFSRAPAAFSTTPNSNVAHFDLALPGSQPEFQKATLIPALRAALALQCTIQRRSKFDRKHYFYQDQPAGYQITQYYEPFARDGEIRLYDYDDIDPEDGSSVTVGIKQIQMEQDTAKSIQQPPDTTLLDFNRVGHPLIEIITLPQIHHAKTAAACVKKIQALLQSVSAVTTGMELGGLRVDVNVSVRAKSDEPGIHIYHGVTGLGQRTEIKNLSSFKAVEDAVIAERDRQISVLASGGFIEGETRGWTLGSTGTRKLRGKEGEVDYRYMPDPDISPVVISKGLIDHVSTTLPQLPDQSIQLLVDRLGISLKDAKTLVVLDDGARLDYFNSIMDLYPFEEYLGGSVTEETVSYAKTTANWVLHELGGLLGASEGTLADCGVSAETMASIVENLMTGRVTGKTAKQLLSMTFNGDTRTINDIVTQDDLAFQSLSQAEYESMALELLEGNPQMVEAITQKKQVKKVKWFVGQMMRKGEGKMEPAKAESVLERMLKLRDGKHNENRE